MTEERIDRTHELWEKFAGKKIIIDGADTEQKRIFVQNLAHFAKQQGIEASLGERLEDASGEDYVFLFGDAQESDSNQILFKLLEKFELLKLLRPKAAVFISDNRVYGKCFGMERQSGQTEDAEDCESQRLFKENELGYVCHTSQAELPLQWLRTAEHLACRLAAEEGLDIKAVRMERHADMEQTLTELLCVLADGARGEIYNVAGRKTGGMQRQSPLSPLKIRTDTEKTARLLAGYR